MKITYIPHQANYEVSLSSECSFFNEGRSTLTYDIEVKHIKTEANVFFIEVSKTNVLMNDEEVHDAFNDMLLITAEAINKVIVRVNESGTVLGLSNFEEIKKKWFHVRSMVEEMYKGDIITNYLDGMQTKLESPEILWSALSKSFFYTVFFNGIYKNYIDSKSPQQEMIIRDLLPTQGVGVLVDQSILLDKEEDAFLLSMKGMEEFDGINQHTKDFFKGQTEALPEMCLVEIEGTYNIVPSNGAINSINMEANVTYDTFYRKNMQIEITKKSH
jgi:hypothetical protein